MALYYCNGSSGTMLLCFYDYGKEKHIEFRTNRFIQKNISLSSTIKTIQMTNLSTHLKNKERAKTNSAKLSTKQLSASQKSRGQGIPIALILQYDIYFQQIFYLMKITHSNLIRPL